MLGSSVVGVTTTVIVLHGFAKIMAGCKNVDREASDRVSACGGSGRSGAVDERHQRR